jgi:hypothetical protein
MSNWTEINVWHYIFLESVPIVPLYLAKVRPVVEREGALIMVDDERLPLAPGEKPVMKKVRFRTLGCYPLTGAIESEADTLPAVIQELLFTKTSAPGPGHRPRHVCFNGKEEAGRILLMPHKSDLAAIDLGAYLRTHEHKSLLRFMTCGSVDDGKARSSGGCSTSLK